MPLLLFFIEEAQNFLGFAKRQKKTYDSKLKIREFQVGDFIWHRNPPTANFNFRLQI
jgi:hypothetical protein